MSLQDVKLKTEYRSLIHNMATDFYVPALEQAVTYHRAVGFFSSTALIEISRGISALKQNNGKIKLIVSPKLSDEDILAISKGYELKEIVEKSLERDLTMHTDKFELERLNLLANLIADGTLDIKIAITETNGNIGMYHEKMGIISDTFGNKLAFSGSMNETFTGMAVNYEAIDVFCSWKSESERVTSKEIAFNSIWNNTEPGVSTIKFDSFNKKIIEKYKTHEPNYNIDREEFIAKISMFHAPENFNFHDYQLDAINNFIDNDFQGIFDMATGTGKTYTALGALERLSQALNNKLGVFIICPYQHLVEQWVEDIKLFGVDPLICYSSYKWKSTYKKTISNFNKGIIDNFCVITTNTTFALDTMQKEIDTLKGDICLVVDEAHNFGAESQLSCMKPIFNKKLALSATLNRHHDEEGTQKLRDYFGKVCIEYSLERAILEGKLTQYKYYPIAVHLDEDELEEYIELSDKIAKYSNVSKYKELYKMLLLKRASIISGAKNKLPALFEIIDEKYKNDNNILVYCGATKVSNSDNLDEKRQLDIVLDMLGNELDMRVTKFTSEENSKEREIIKENFAKGSMLQAIVAIKCLDEGVNIPSIKTAFILASSTNPKEYIQRRGRVLRLYEGKQYAEIYDFITLPRSLDDDNSDIKKSERSLVKREFERMKDFADLAINTSDALALKQEISDFYKLNYIN